MGKELLFEIGTEEIPAAFLPKAIVDLREMTAAAFAAERIKHGEIKAMATPRRLCLYVADVAERQEDQIIEKMGPAKKVAFDEQGQPSKALIGFAKGQGLEIRQLETVSTPKGEYLCARKQITGRESLQMLPGILLKLITSMSFKKSMRWADFETRFPRPIHWILALFGGNVIPLQIENIVSGRITYGHRFMSPGGIEIGSFADYLAQTRERFVIVDPEERKGIILREAGSAAQSVSGKILPNDELLETVTFLVEYPSAVCGSFDRDYLNLPREVLITSMMSHQKYFPVVDGAGKLLPHFITINNTVARDSSVVVRGNEKVIRARLSDARFFFEEDQKISLDRRFEDLKNVVYHSQLGTSHDKVMRFRRLAAWIVDRINPALKATVDRAAVLAKADLDTQMVGEFSELQGVMGREYALLAGENPVVAKAVFEHYLPIAAGGSLPGTDEGAIISVADKMDTLCGLFGVNLIPSGTADPYALRRQALGIINIILDKQYPIPLADFINQSLMILGHLLKRPAPDIQADVLAFFQARFENQLNAQGHPYDVVSAVLATGISDLFQALKKIEAMEAFKSHKDFLPLAIAFKRAGNIIKGFPGGSVNPALFEYDQEKDLYDAFQAIQEQAAQAIDKHDYLGALIDMARLRRPVDAFFEAVLVMAKEEQIRQNRLSLLARILALFNRIADFSRIVTE